jgi:integrase
MTPDSRNLFRNHERCCPHRKKGRAHKKCHCPIWIDFSFDGKRILKSLGTRNWQLAQDLLREWETNELRAHEKAKLPQIPEPEKESEPRGPTVADACTKFLADARARGLRDATVYKFRLLLGRLQGFTRERGIHFVSEITVEMLREFRAALPHRNTAARRRVEELRTFFGFCLDAGWVSINPAKSLKPPPCTEAPIEPFGDEEVERIRAACVSYFTNTGKATAQRLDAIVDLMLCTGLRIQDAVTLRKDCVAQGNLRVRTEKTGTIVYFPLPMRLIEKLERMRSTSLEYFFWSGQSKPKSVVGNLQRSLKKLFKLAGVAGGHAHRFRHTFAKRLFMKGVPADRVAVLMGHRSPAITVKHYGSWGKDRQAQLEADIRRIWDADEPPKQSPKPLKRPESAIQTLYGNSLKWIN